MQKEMRRKARQMDSQEAQRILEQCEYAMLTTVDAEGEPHTVPISPVLLGDKLYFHCAPQGEKLDNIAQNPRVSLCTVAECRTVREKMTVAYRSVVAQGHARLAQGEERLHALLEICRKFGPPQEEIWQDEIQKFPNTAIVCVDLRSITGKWNAGE